MKNHNFRCINLSDLAFEDNENLYYYKHCSVSGAKKIICNGTLYFNLPDDFNDPFDCRFAIHESRVTAEKIIDLNIRRGILPTETYVIDGFEKIKNIISDGSYERKLFSDLAKDFGVTCFNRNPLSILMWSHYAEKHKGILLEFKISKDDPDFDFIPHEVLYLDEFPVIGKDGKILDAFLIKSKEWYYEQEYRAIKKLKKGEKIFEFSREKHLSSVIFGLNTDENVIEQLSEFISIFNGKACTGIELFRAISISKKYEVTVPNHPRLDVIANSKKKK